MRYGVHPCREVLLDLLFQMKRQLIGKFLVDFLFPKQRAQTMEEFHSGLPRRVENRFDFKSRNSYHCGMKTTVSEKGQITIPKPLRVRLGIRVGQVLEVKEERGRLVMTKRAPRDPFDKYFGILKLGRSTDEIMDELRGLERPR
jgi:AbrB family looped-hinge helix DNA binding protein